MRELVRGYLVAVLETAEASGHRGLLSDQLRVLSEAVGSHRSLLQVLSDPSLTANARRSIVADLLVDKSLEETSSLATFAVRAERPAEASTVLAQLVTAAGRPSPGAPGGGDAIGIEGAAGGAGAAGGDAARTGGREYLRGYAERVLQELAGPDEVDEVEDELFRFARVLDAEARLRSVLADRAAPVVGRLALLEDLLGGRVQPGTLRLARFVIRAGRLRDLVGTFEWLVELAAAERGRRVAEVRSAVPLEDAERDRLAVALGRLVGRTVEIRVVLDPLVVGGMLVRVGDLVIDGTVRSRLDKLREALAGSS